MDKETHFRKLEHMYLIAPCNEYYNLKIKVSKAKAEIYIPITEKFYQAGRTTHGSVYFKAADDAGFFSAQSLVSDYFLLTGNYTIYFIHPIDSGVLQAVGNVVYRGKSYFIAESIIFDSNGQQIGRGSGTYIRTKTLLTEVVGYCL